MLLSAAIHSSLDVFVHCFASKSVLISPWFAYSYSILQSCNNNLDILTKMKRKNHHEVTTDHNSHQNLDVRASKVCIQAD